MLPEHKLRRQKDELYWDYKTQQAVLSDKDECFQTCPRCACDKLIADVKQKREQQDPISHARQAGRIAVCNELLKEWGVERQPDDR